MDLGPNGNSQTNPLMFQFYTWDAMHPTMSWWAYFESEVPHLAQLGVTQVWLPPPNKATHKLGQGYDAYDLWDLGEFDQKGTKATRWGTKEELQQAVSTAKAHGIDVIIDAVLNHKIGADRTEVFKAVPVNEKNRHQEAGPPREIEGWTAYDFKGRGGKYSSMRWTHEHFTGLDWDHRSKKNAIYRIAHKPWSPNVDQENGNYDYLLGIDIDLQHPEVKEDLKRWGTWVLDTIGASGFRLDAIKHMDHKFLLEWIHSVRKQPNRSRTFAVGEYWSGDGKSLLNYVKNFKGQLSFFDVPLHYRFHETSKAGATYDLRTIMNDTVLWHQPHDAVTFVDNHEYQIGQTLESWVYNAFKLQAYALILLRGEGHPCVFYGDLYANKECDTSAIAPILRKLMGLRKAHAHGPVNDYFHDRNCIGFVRMGEKDRAGCVVVISNADKEGKAQNAAATHTIPMFVGKHNAKKVYTASLGSSERVQVSAKGWAHFACPPGGLQVWVPTL
ncbi:glycoside hydrolase family 13 protein [Stereum hirsutum FP-91666 SS1]|uniref:glycoside hydrolase family 13 protein n=1 Tax=Stereum hirsutum (strain FP-91666) TaxID=721885 RepID=UPI000440A083|nr:glycoside hydrolase family 13 protein [Stereum hirsutum FP-91666 SS1]EIM91274.1 glycoside hydrolase family 13 protein [Stereum hirsutum FP-91666 SS1]